MNVILKELEKRQRKLDEYQAKVEELEALKAKAACLEKEVAETNTFELKDEIKELTAYAIELKLISPPVEETDEPATETVEETVESPTYQPTITSL